MISLHDFSAGRLTAVSSRPGERNGMLQVVALFLLPGIWVALVSSASELAAQQAYHLSDLPFAETADSRVMESLVGEGGVVTHATPFRIPTDLQAEESEIRSFYHNTAPVHQATMLQPTPFVEPRVSTLSGAPTPVAGTTLSARLFAEPGVARSFLRHDRETASFFRNDIVRGTEASPLSTSDLGSLLNKSRSAISTEVQRRTPIVNDPRIRSSRIGSLAASGSYWVPARADLDTAVSKIDSRLIQDAVIIPGPYSSLYGPGFNHLDFRLLESPRFQDGVESHGQTSFDHHSNGNRWMGQQSLWAGGKDWGIRGNYTHRTGGDYRDGAGNRVPSGYESRELTVALGKDLSDGDRLELSVLRLDQTDVFFPGYVFDIDFLVADGYSGTYVDVNPMFADQTETEVWYNRTRFEGNAQNPTKRAQFPFLDRVFYVGQTDVDSFSTGYRRGRTWGRPNEDWSFTLGHDLRFIKQELNEIADVVTLGLPVLVTDRNSPIPRSFHVNPGIFFEYDEVFLEDWGFRTGGRVDYVQTDVVDDPQKLSQLGLGVLPATLDEILGTDQTQTDRFLWSLYGSLRRQLSETLNTSVSVGFAQRPPTLTELYAAEPFLLLLQNGLNNVTGDPRLKNEKMLQFDYTLDYDTDRIKAGLRGFHGWAFDYITFENTGVVIGPPAGEVQQINLRYVNTDLATLAGFESFLELWPRSQLSPFATLRYVEGRDRARDGSFATIGGSGGFQSSRVAGLPRGSFSGMTGEDAEALPGISPMEARFGVRLQGAGPQPSWNVDFSARVVDGQDRVATSLLETPTPGFTIYDVRATYRPRFMDHLLVVGGIENLTNKLYQEHLDFRAPNGLAVFQPGRDFYFGVDWVY